MKQRGKNNNDANPHTETGASVIGDVSTKDWECPMFTFVLRTALLKNIWQAQYIPKRFK